LRNDGEITTITNCPITIKSIWVYGFGENGVIFSTNGTYCGKCRLGIINILWNDSELYGKKKMELNKLKLERLNQYALLVSIQAFNHAIKCGFQDTTNNSKAYVLYKICTTICETEPKVECELDLYCAKMVYGSLQRILNSICTDAEQYHVEVLDACEESIKVWHAFNQMKYILDNFENELFCK
jgi:hypothetical protein